MLVDFIARCHTVVIGPSVPVASEFPTDQSVISANAGLDTGPADVLTVSMMHLSPVVCHLWCVTSVSPVVCHLWCVTSVSPVVVSPVVCHLWCVHLWCVTCGVSPVFTCGVSPACRPVRFLPDKAIDLVDEAAAKLKMEITSKPEALDEIDRKVLQLEMERLSLGKVRGVTTETGCCCQRLPGALLSSF